MKEDDLHGILAMLETAADPDQAAMMSPYAIAGMAQRAAAALERLEALERFLDREGIRRGPIDHGLPTPTLVDRVEAYGHECAARALTATPRRPMTMREIMEAEDSAPEPRAPTERQTLADRLGKAFIDVQFDHKLTPRDWLLDLLLEAGAALRTPSQPAGPTREQVAQIIESTLGYTNGWRVTDEQYREDCLAAADQILGFGDAAPREEG